MKIRYILLLIITVLGVSSCYDDKGNYSYDPKNDIKITFDIYLPSYSVRYPQIYSVL